MNTMTDKEWGDGTETVDMFNPENVDTDQWCKVFKDSGSKGVILLLNIMMVLLCGIPKQLTLTL